MTILGLSAVGLLFVALAVARAERSSARGAALEAPPRAFATPSSARERALVLALLLAGLAPAITLGVLHPGRVFGDALTHARVGQELAEGALARGWITSFLGGFPYAIHYPPLGTLLIALFIALGASALEATNLLGLLGVIAVPLALTGSLLWARARPAYALLGGLATSWIAPYNGFVGGLESFFSIGLVSQVVAMPIATVFVAAVVLGRRAAPAVALGVLLVLAHPQIAVATLAVLWPSILVATRDRARLARAARATAAILASALALYGPGLTQLGVPFGWPSGMAWRHLGFPLSRLEPLLLDGWLLDEGRAPVVTWLAAVAALALALQAKRPSARAALAIVVTLSVSGQTILHAGALGRALLAVLQPLRVAALVQLAAPLAIVVALEESSARLEGALMGRARPSARLVASVLALSVALVLGPALRERIASARAIDQALARRDAAPCGEETPPGYDAAAVRRALGALTRGRLWYDTNDRGFAGQCVDLDALILATRLPIANTAALGAHVGIEWAAGAYLAPEQPGGGARAEALGVRYGVASSAASWPGFHAIAALGPLHVLERDTGSDLVGVGCVTERWSASDAALRARLFEALEAPERASRLLDPHRFVELVTAKGALRVEPRAEPCELGRVDVEERSLEPGRIEATITSEGPIDVVLRVTASPSWRVTVDGRPIERPRLAAPGFILLSLPRGRSELRAIVGWQRGYGVGLAVALGIALAAARERASRRRGGTERAS